MESFFYRYRNALTLIAVLLVQTIALATQVRRDDVRSDGHHVRLVRLWMHGILTPPEQLFTYTGHGIRGLWHSYIDLRGTRRQNADLRLEVEHLRLREAAIAEDARQAERLRALMQFREQYPAKTVAAQVIGTSGIDNARLLTIDKGANDGLKPDQAVMTPDGIIGKLRNVFASTSELLLISDPTSGAGVILENTRLRGILRGSANGVPVISNLLPDNRIKVGDRILTSGGDRIFPRGLPVGSIAKIGLDPDHQPYALLTVQPAANLSRLEEVLIVTEMAQQLPDGPPGTLAVTEPATTSQIVAERLPGLHDDATAKPADKNTAPDVVAAPRPGAALRPDRYSPGTAPAAASLKPGARTSTTGGQQ